MQETGGLAMVGFKAEEAVRTRETNFVPAISADELRAATGALEAAGVEIRTRYRNVAAVAVRLDPAQGPAIRQWSFVNYVEPMARFALGSQSTPWGVAKVGAPTAWTGLPSGETSTGSGVAVRIIDSGMDTTHRDLQRGTGVELECWWASIYDDCLDESSNGHGTHVAGIVFAQNNAVDVVGVAPGIRLIGAYRIGLQTNIEEYLVAALDAISDTDDPGIINMSIWQIAADDSVSGYSSTVAEAVARAYTAGHLLVSITGNYGQNFVSYPGSDTNVIAVAGTRSDDTPYSSQSSPCNSSVLSNFGPEAELAAPFEALSTIPGDTTGVLCGTSQAAPHVAGVAALLWSRVPSRSNVDIRRRLRETAFVPPGWDTDYGDGRVDAVRALTLGVSLAQACDTVLEPTTNCTFTPTVTRNEGSVSYVWYAKECTGCGESQVATSATFTPDTLDRVFDTDSATYRVRLVVTDSWGLKGHDTATVHRYAPWTPLSAEIYGPDAIPDDMECLFNASYAYGVPPYSFAWYKGTNPNPVSETDTYWAASTQPFYLVLVVGDRLGSIADTLSVAIEPGFCAE